MTDFADRLDDEFLNVYSTTEVVDIRPSIQSSKGEQFVVWIVYHTLSANGMIILAVCSTEEKAEDWITNAPILSFGKYGKIPAVVDDETPYGKGS